MKAGIEQKHGSIMLYLLAMAAGLACFLPGFASAQAIIEKVAGGKVEAEDVPAVSVSLYNPYGVALDSSSNLYIADYDSHRIRKVTPSGTISTVAGNGIWGNTGDGGSATAAKVGSPHGVAVDSGGNIYIADNQFCCIRKVDTSGTISTVAGTGIPGYSGDGGAATAAQLNYPTGVALDGSGNLYIADAQSNCIRMVDTAGTITTVAGNGTPGYAGDGGAATAAQLSTPQSVALDIGGNLYVVDYQNNRIRRVNTSGLICTVAGNGTNGYSGDGGGRQLRRNCPGLPEWRLTAAAASILPTAPTAASAWWMRRGLSPLWRALAMAGRPLMRG